MKRFAILLGLLLAAAAPAAGQPVGYTYTQFDSDKCRHSPGRDAEDYGSWLCPGHAGIAVRLSAGDQRMNVSFGPIAAKEPAARQTFPAFNHVYRGTIEWRRETPADGKARPFAAILRWNVRLPDDGRDATGRVLVVTRLGAGGVCHVGYVDARANPDANDLARQIADRHARTFKCGADAAVVLGKVSPDLAMPEGR